MFKKPRRNKIVGKIHTIETAVDKVKWHSRSHTPLFIGVTVERKDKATGKIITESIWTSENKLMRNV